MSPLKTELLLRLALGQKRFQVGTLTIDLIYGTTLGKIPEEIRGHIKNLMRRARKERTISIESSRMTRKRKNGRL